MITFDKNGKLQLNENQQSKFMSASQKQANLQGMLDDSVDHIGTSHDSEDEDFTSILQHGCIDLPENDSECPYCNNVF